MSWIHAEDGYQLLCNRDEKRTRLSAIAPEVRMSGGVAYISPIDGDFGGTWIASNEFGITLALLNGPVNAPRGTIPGAKSRGHLIADLSDSRSIQDVRRRIAQEDLGTLACLTLVALQPGEPASLFEWDGWHLTITENAEHRMPVTSSSFDQAGVQEWRLQEFSARLRRSSELSLGVLLDFHRSHGLTTENPSAYSPCMHRSEAETVSFTMIDVSETEVKCLYSPGAPCQSMPGETVRLPRNVASLAMSGRQ